MSVKMFKPFVVAIEGNIGSGKTTLLERLKANSKSNTLYLEEPVDQWTDVGGHNILEAFYKNPDRYGLMLETLILLTNLERDNIKTDKEFIVQERSIVSSLLFTPDMCEMDQVLHKRYVDCLKNVPSHVPDLIVYIQTPPEVCLERIAKRGRKEEASISLERLRVLHDRHEAWLNNGTGKDTMYATPVMVVDDNSKIERLF